MSLGLHVKSQEACAQSLVQPEEDVPVVVDEEQVVSVVTRAQLLSCQIAEQQFGLYRASRYTVVLLRGSFIHLGILFILLFLLGVGQHAPLREKQVGDEVVNDLLDLVFVLFLDAGLSLDMVDDESGGIL